MSSRCWRSTWLIASVGSFSQGSQMPEPSKADGVTFKFEKSETIFLDFSALHNADLSIICQIQCTQNGISLYFDILTGSHFVILDIKFGNDLPAIRIPDARHSRTLRRASPAPIGRFPVPIAFSHSSSKGYKKRDTSHACQHIKHLLIVLFVSKK